MRVNGPKEFVDAGKGPTGRKDVAESTLKVPDVIFGDKFVLDDGKQCVEFLFFGHGHTAGARQSSTVAHQKNLVDRPAAARRDAGGGQ